MVNNLQKKKKMLVTLFWQYTCTCPLSKLHDHKVSSRSSDMIDYKCLYLHKYLKSHVTAYIPRWHWAYTFNSWSIFLQNDLQHTQRMNHTQHKINSYLSQWHYSVFSGFLQSLDAMFCDITSFRPFHPFHPCHPSCHHLLLEDLP